MKRVKTKNVNVEGNSLNNKCDKSDNKNILHEHGKKKLRLSYMFNFT